MKTFLFAIYLCFLITNPLVLRASDEEGSVRTDSALLDSLVRIGEDHYYNNLDSAEYYWQKVIDLSDGARDSSIMRVRSVALNNMGVLQSDKGNKYKALDLLTKALRVRHELNDSLGLGETYNNIGFVYRNSGDIKEAIKYYNLSLEIKELMGDSTGVSTSYNNIGTIYDDFGEYEKALEYYDKALELRKGLGMERKLAQTYNNKGYTYRKMGRLDEAMKYFKKSNSLYQSLESRRGQSYSYSNMGDVYRLMGNLDSAKYYYLKSYSLDSALGDQYGLAYSYTNLGAIYRKFNQPEKSLYYLKKGMQLSQKLGFPHNMVKSAKGLSDIYQNKGDYQKAYRYLWMYKQLSDSLHSEESKKELIRKELEYSFQKKKAKLEVQQRQKELMMKAERERQKLISNAFMAGFGLMLVIAFLSFRSYRLKKKSGKEIKAQKDKVERKNQQLEEKNSEIIDSITYAKKIQKALLREGEELPSFFPEHFVFFKPKDIVSGDFYWFQEKEGYLYITVADCTGHGVPGAFLTMLGTSYLNEINAGKEQLKPSWVLNSLRERLIKELRGGKEEGSRDGMDMALVRLNLKTGELLFAGANNPLYIVRENRDKSVDEYDYKLSEIKGDKQPIGPHIKQKPFTDQEVKLNDGDAFYLFSDGYADQFGGPKGKKFKYKSLKQLILRVQDESMKKQRLTFDAVFNEWKGELEQIDDVCVMGMKYRKPG